MQVRDDNLPEALRAPVRAAWRYFMRRSRAALRQIAARLGLPAACLTELLEGNDLPGYKSSSLLRCFRYPGTLLHQGQGRMHTCCPQSCQVHLCMSASEGLYTTGWTSQRNGGCREYYQCNALSLIHRDGARRRGAHTAPWRFGVALLLLAECARPGALCARDGRPALASHLCKR